VNGQDSKAEIYDVFLCHKSVDKPAVREIGGVAIEEKFVDPLIEDDRRHRLKYANVFSATLSS
jgi:hypothetical protein